MSSSSQVAVIGAGLAGLTLSGDLSRARAPDFQRQVSTWVEQGVAAEWRGRFGSLDQGRVTPEQDSPVRYVGVPGMSAVARRLASDVDVRSGVRVERLRRDSRGWALTSETGEALGTFERVMLALPAPQAAALLTEVPALAARVAAVSMSPCWALMAHFDARPRSTRAPSWTPSWGWGCAATGARARGSRAPS